MSNRIKMTYSCDQSWDDMTPTDRGKFCLQCQEEVIDYSSLSKKEFKKLARPNEGLCGRFRLDQVEPDIIAEIKAPSFVKRIALASSITLAGTGFSQHSEPIQTEQHDTSLDPEVAENTAEEEEERPWYIKKNGEYKKPFISTRRNAFYFVRKFPYIKRKHIFYRVGKF